MEKYSITTAQQFSEDRFTKVNIIKSPKSVAFMLNFLPGQHMKPHNHPKRELYLNVIEGNGILLINDEELEVSVGDVIFCGAEDQIGFTNTGQSNTSIYVVMSEIVK